MEVHSNKNWFKDWFNSPYYHLLYRDRNYDEATLFIKSLVEKLELQNEKVLDLACGKGRHALALNELGLDVLGLDLADDSIKAAKEFENSSLRFDVHDMREVYPEKFDVIFNLFTSFGYFDGQQDNLKMLNSIHEMLQDKGKIVIDFMNSAFVVKTLIEKENKVIEGIEFHIKRWSDGKHIFKQIDFEADNIPYSFTEKVQVISIQLFQDLLAKAGFKKCFEFGDYLLNPFDELSSKRLILIYEKA